MRAFVGRPVATTENAAVPAPSLRPYAFVASPSRGYQRIHQTQGMDSRPAYRAQILTATSDGQSSGKLHWEHRILAFDGPNHKQESTTPANGIFHDGHCGNSGRTDGRGKIKIKRSIVRPNTFEPRAIGTFVSLSDVIIGVHALALASQTMSKNRGLLGLQGQGKRGPWTAAILITSR